MSIDMYVSASQRQASSTKRMVQQQLEGYQQMERAIGQFLFNSQTLTGAAYDSAKQHYSSVLLPLVKGGKLYSEAVARCVAKLPNDYQAKVDSGDLKESELEKKIAQLDAQIRAKREQQAHLRSLSLHLPSEERGRYNRSQTSLSNSIETLKKSKKKLKEKLQKLRRFNISSVNIFAGLAGLQRNIAMGSKLATSQWDGSVFVRPSKEQMAWADEINKFQAEKEINEWERKHGDIKEWNSLYKKYIKANASNFKSIWYGARISRLSDGTLIVTTTTGLSKKLDELTGFSKFVKENKNFARIGSKFGELTEEGVKILKESKLNDFDMLTKGITNRIKDSAKATIKATKSNVISSVTKPLTFGMKSLIKDAKSLKTAKGFGKVVPGLNLVSGIVDVDYGFKDSTNMAKKDGLKGGQIVASQVGGMMVDVGKVAVTTSTATVAATAGAALATTGLAAVGLVVAGGLFVSVVAVKAVEWVDKKAEVTKKLKKGVNGIIKGVGGWFK